MAADSTAMTTMLISQQLPRDQDSLSLCLLSSSDFTPLAIISVWASCVSIKTIYLTFGVHLLASISLNRHSQSPIDAIIAFSEAQTIDAAELSYCTVPMAIDPVDSLYVQNAEANNVISLNHIGTHAHKPMDPRSCRWLGSLCRLAV
ncbi:hypothetical protein FA15DRAFT_350709 [Coprinopsis marcescibilis]|uniref:Uncharacterized protein n=1 Tax=Coprinopsis marcescibilis TaxID=230819 RepID=A0A5C3LB47_COPMA|nr:hypothetical protein FA15DRAFT_350709 [Coprinopsis marcescibilis]